MPIPVSCKCGQRFAAKDELAGKVAKCPKCGQALRIPQPQAPQAAGPSKQRASASPGAAPAPQAATPRPSPLAELFDEVGIQPAVEVTGPRCPSCNEPMAEHAVLCVNCGYHLQTGKQIKGVAATLEEDKDRYGLGEEDGHAAAARLALKKAERAIKDDAIEEYKIRTQGMPIWALALAFAAIVCFCVSMSLLPTGTALLISGFTLAVGSTVVQFVCGVLILVVAFKESLACGLMSLFVPFYSLYYIITRWQDCKAFFIISLLCNVPATLGGFMIGWGTNYKDEEGKGPPRGKQTSQLDPATPSHFCAIDRLGGVSPPCRTVSRQDALSRWTLPELALLQTWRLREARRIPGWMPGSDPPAV